MTWEFITGPSQQCPQPSLRLAVRSIFPAERKLQTQLLPRFYHLLQENWGRTEQFKGKWEQDAEHVTRDAVFTDPTQTFLVCRKKYGSDPQYLW